MYVKITYVTNEDLFHEAHASFGMHNEHGAYGIGSTKEKALEDLARELSLKLWKIYDAVND